MLLFSEEFLRRQPGAFNWQGLAIHGLTSGEVSTVPMMARMAALSGQESFGQAENTACNPAMIWEAIGEGVAITPLILLALGRVQPPPQMIPPRAQTELRPHFGQTPQPDARLLSLILGGADAFKKM